MPCDYRKYSKNWKTEIRPAILERAGHKCERCGFPKSDLHHVRTKAAMPELRNEPANHCMLCEACHAWAHGSPKDARNWFRQVRPDDAATIGIGREVE